MFFKETCNNFSRRLMETLSDVQLIVDNESTFSDTGIKIDNSSVVGRLEIVGKRALENNLKIQKIQTLEGILKDKRARLMKKALHKWQLKSKPQMAGQVVHQILCNGPVSKVTVFHRLFHHPKDKEVIVQQTMHSLILQKGQNSRQVVENVMKYLLRRSRSSLVGMAKLHDSLSLLAQDKQKEIMEDIKFKINEAEFSHKHNTLKGVFASIDSKIRGQFSIFKEPRLRRLLTQLLYNKAKKYMQIWFVKANSTLLPSQISAIKIESYQRQPSSFWTQLLNKPTSSQISGLTKVTDLPERSGLRENSNQAYQIGSSRSKFSPKQMEDMLKSAPKKMFLQDKPKRSEAGLLFANSYSYMSKNSSSLQSPPPNKDLSAASRNLYLTMSSIVKMRLCWVMGLLKQPARHANQLGRKKPSPLKSELLLLSKVFNNLVLEPLEWGFQCIEWCQEGDQ